MAVHLFSSFVVVNQQGSKTRIVTLSESRNQIVGYNSESVLGAAGTLFGQRQYHPPHFLISKWEAWLWLVIAWELPWEKVADGRGIGEPVGGTLPSGSNSHPVNSQTAWERLLSEFISVTKPLKIWHAHVLKYFTI